MHLLKIRHITIIIIFSMLGISSCSRHGLVTRSTLVAIRPVHDYNAKDTSYTPDYNDSTMWYLYNNKNKAVDVFFVHPTTYINPKQWNMPLNDSTAIKLLKEYSLIPQASVFEDVGNIYVPQYRQATFYAFVTRTNNGDKALELATKDVKNAWEYFLKNINKDRPIIIAGHSQGSMIILRLLPEIMKDSVLAKRIIAVYAVGWPISKNYLSHNPQIKVCEDSTQTGCVISWNTESRNAKASIIDRPSVSVNPLSWTTDEKLAPKELNKGAVFYHRNAEADTIVNYVSAQNIDGHLKVSKLPNKLELNIKIGFGLYHIYDYNMFYMNIKENIRVRTEYYCEHTKYRNI